jgi:hypothetical protein
VVGPVVDPMVVGLVVVVDQVVVGPVVDPMVVGPVVVDQVDPVVARRPAEADRPEGRDRVQVPEHLDRVRVPRSAYNHVRRVSRCQTAAVVVAPSTKIRRENRRAAQAPSARKAYAARAATRRCRTAHAVNRAK